MRKLFSLFISLLFLVACASDTEQKQGISSTQEQSATDNDKAEEQANSENDQSQEVVKPKVEDLRSFGEIKFLETANCAQTPHLFNTAKEPLFFTLTWQKEDGSFGFLQERCIYPSSKIAFQDKCIGEDIKSIAIKEARRPNENEKNTRCD